MILTWSNNCFLARMTPAISAPARLEFVCSKLYVPVVALSTENDKKLLGQLKSDLKEL